MIDAKRLAEMMTPDSMRTIAGLLDELRHNVASAGALEMAAAVLREVAGRAQGKVIEVELEQCTACDFHGSEQQNGPTCALVKGLLDPMPWRDGQPAPPDCPLRFGRIIIQAKQAAEKRKG